MINVMKLSLDRRSNTELSTQVASQIRRLILNREIYPNRPMPTISELAEKLACDDAIIEKAYYRLIDENLVYQTKEEIFYVAFYDAPKTVLTDFTSIYKSIEKLGFTPSSKTISKEVIDCDQVKDYPKADDCNKLFRLQRVYFADGNPVAFMEALFPLDRFKGLDKLDFETKALQEIFKDEYGISPSRTSRKFKAEIGSDKICEALNIEKNSTLLATHLQAFDDQNDLIESSVTYVIEHIQIEWQIEAKDLDHFY